MLPEQFFKTIRSLIKSGIEKKNFDFKQVSNLISSYDFELLEKLQDLSRKFGRVKNLNLYGNFFVIITSYLRKIKGQGLIENVPLITEKFIDIFINGILNLLVLDKFCAECNSRNIYVTSNPFNENRILYFCRNCQKSVRVFQSIEFIPILILYLNRWSLNSNPRGILNDIFDVNFYYKDFINFLFQDCLSYYKDKGDLLSFLFYYKILEINEIEHNILKDKLLFKSILIDNMKKALKKQDFLGFVEGRNLFQAKYGDLNGYYEHIFDLILNALLESLKSGEYLKIKYALKLISEENFSEMLNFTSNKKLREQIEQNFYFGLSRSLELRKFNNFRQTLNLSDNFDIFINVKKIPHRTEIVSNLLMNCIQEISVGYHTSSLGDIIEIIKFFNEYNLLVKDFDKDELKVIKEIKKDKLFLSNLEDLFGYVSNSLIYFVYKDLPSNLYDFFIGEPNSFSFYTNAEQMASYISMFFDRYSVYGLSVQKIGNVSRFIKKCGINLNSLKSKDPENKKKKSNGDPEFFEFYYRNQKHLVAPENIIKNQEKISAKEYNFYSLSMVLLGGLGPQGHGFTYSTPKGEVIEICSDIKENEAIIVKYKQFLKRQFLAKLEPEMIKLHVDPDIIKKIMKYLSEIIDKKELINYFKKGVIIKKIKNFLYENSEHEQDRKKDIEELMKKISNAITMILRKIKMEDQFRTRMELVSRDKIKSEDIAKLTSLKEKSHYDVLRERFFFQYIVKWFYKIHAEKKLNIQ